MCRLIKQTNSRFSLEILRCV